MVAAITGWWGHSASTRPWGYVWRALRILGRAGPMQRPRAIPVGMSRTVLVHLRPTASVDELLLVTDLLHALAAAVPVVARVELAGDGPARREPGTTRVGIQERTDRWEVAGVTLSKRQRSMLDVFTRQSSCVRGTDELIAALRVNEPRLWRKTTRASLRGTYARLRKKLTGTDLGLCAADGCYGLGRGCRGGLGKQGES